VGGRGVGGARGKNGEYRKVGTVGGEGGGERVDVFSTRCRVGLRVMDRELSPL